MDLNRRRFIQVGGMGLLVAACAPARIAPGREWVADGLRNDEGAPLLITIFLRGGADGLALVPPTGDPGYEKLRGSLALRDTIPFSKTFSLHPELTSLVPLVQRGQLAVVHAAGSQNPTRSHFEAQDIMELGGASPARVEEGWLTRALRGSNVSDPFSSLSLTAEQPLALRGSGAFAIGDADRFGLPGVSARARSAMEARYRNGSDAVSTAGAHALAALSDYERAMGTGVSSLASRLLRGRRPGRNDLTTAAEQLLRVERSGLGLRAAFLESDGWDTHSNQGSEQGSMARRVRDLGDGIAKLAEGLAERRDWLVVAMTEFGRTVRPNGSGGSDHGHGSVMLVAGPRVRGAAYGSWSGLSERHLYEGRDLPVLTDWRSVSYELLRAHLGQAPPPETFPNFVPEGLGLVG